MKPKILIVDDDNNLRETLKDILETEGYHIQEAASGAEAIRLVQENLYHAILMDFQLLDQTGIDVIRQIRQINTESVILMMTGYASLDTAVKAIQESVYDYLIKPVDPAYLKRTLKKSLEKWQLAYENRKLIEILKKTNLQLTHLNNMKSKFLSMVSHDLANALTTLQVSLEMLMTHVQPTEKDMKFFLYAKNSIDQIHLLVGDLVDWASIEKGKLRLEKSQFELPKMVQELLPGPLHKSRLKNIRLECDIPENLPPVFADKRRIGQVLTNLLENAIRHTPREGEIRIGARLADPQGAYLQISIKDSGNGLSPAEIPRIFEGFYQAGGESVPHGRLGLGLAIARELVQGHNGQIWAESEGLGKGTTFYFSLPVRPQETSVKPVPPAPPPLHQQ